jgi:Carboxypeptidase regulatory-like domain
VGAAMSAMMAFPSTASAQFPLIQINPAQTRRVNFSISGVVADATGAVMPGAQVTISLEGSDKGFSLHSSGTGAFRQDSLSRGFYMVRISSPGFSIFTKRVLIGLAPEYQLRATLAVGTVGGTTIEIKLVPVSLMERPLTNHVGN